MGNDPAEQNEGHSTNRLLAALPRDVLQRLSADLKNISLRPKQILYKPGDRIDHVYFSHGGVFSITTMLEDGSTVEAATVGDEGMVGLEAFLSTRPVSPGQILWQVPDGHATKLAVEPFRREVDRRGVFYDLLGMYAQVVIAQMMQSSACNALHVVQERCARWLLVTQDRVHRDEFQLSHELLATMLGARRPTVTVVARTLQAAGLISYTRGSIKIVDRAGLEAAACPCYAVIRDQYARLFREFR